MSGRWWRAPVEEVHEAILPAIDEMVSKTRAKSRQEGEIEGHQAGSALVRNEYDRRRNIAGFDAQRNYRSPTSVDFVSTIDQSFGFDADRFQVAWPRDPISARISGWSRESPVSYMDVEQFVLVPMAIDKEFSDGSRAQIRWRNVAPASSVRAYAFQVEGADVVVQRALDVASQIAATVPIGDLPYGVTLYPLLESLKRCSDQLRTLNGQMNAVLEKYEWDPRAVKARADQDRERRYGK